ncbi:MAG: hypothetical protein RIS83_1436 [Pseudomonadota bacterium]
MSPESGIGATPRRREDLRFVTGQGRYLDDIQIEGLLHAHILRSPHAHAEITEIDIGDALKLPGVHAVLTSQDVKQDGLQAMQPAAKVNAQTNEALTFLAQPLLADGKVRYAGEAVALVIADHRHLAEDAAEKIRVTYKPLPAVLTASAARQEQAPIIAANVARNTCLDWRWGHHDEVAAAFARAAHRVSAAVTHQRTITNPMEPRGVLGQWDAADGRYILHLSSQNLHANRDLTAAALNVSPEDVRFIAPDVGGGFGAKNFFYPEHALIPWAARRLGRPIKWIATRSEAFLSDHQARDHSAHAELALDAEGNFLALRIESDANIGAYMIGSTGAVQTAQYVHLQGSVYSIPAIALEVRAVLTNTVPVGVTRSPGFAESVNIIERLIDRAARQCGFDRIELRRRNFLPSQQMPTRNALGFSIDSGTFRETFDAAIQVADLPGFATRRAQSESQGKRRGLGIAYHIKGTGGSPHENAKISFPGDDRIVLTTGTQSIGQGHETSFPQILADLLGIADQHIELAKPDTDLIPIGGGHGSSRATYMAGTAIWHATQQVIAKGKAFAARIFEMPEAAIIYDRGIFSVTQKNASMDLFRLAHLARSAGEPLDSYHRWTREHMTFPNGVQIAEVEIDTETGETRLVSHHAVEDYGVLINPMIATGQAHGALAQGIGHALMETAQYDPHTGQPLSASFQDYALPRAADLPVFDIQFNPSRCVTNPLGVKGAGEAAINGIYPAIGNAILDALAPLGVQAIDAPAQPCRIWLALQNAQAR